MPTLYVENVPKGIYEGLRRLAKSHRRSIAAETISILEERVPTAAKRRDREAFYQRVMEIRERTAAGKPGPSAEELLREDRDR